MFNNQNQCIMSVVKDYYLSEDENKKVAHSLFEQMISFVNGGKRY